MHIIHIKYSSLQFFLHDKKDHLATAIVNYSHFEISLTMLLAKTEDYA